MFLKQRSYLAIDGESSYPSLLAIGYILVPYTFNVVHVDPRQLRLHIEPIGSQLQSCLELCFRVDVGSFGCLCILLLCVQEVVPMRHQSV
jgi:hypothetical protein